MKRLLWVIFLVFLLMLGSAAAESAPAYQLGDTIEDFPVVTGEDENVTLSSLLMTEAELSEALGNPARNPEDYFIWPMAAAGKDGRSVVASTNAGGSESRAAVTVQVEAGAGDAIAITFKISSEAAADLLSIQMNGKQMKYFGGEHDWMTYALPVETAGSHEITLSYTKDSFMDTGEDAVFIDSVTVLSGQAAADALAANPVYPVGDEIAIVPVDCQAREIVFEDEGGVLASVFGPANYYIVDADAVTLHATLTEEIDPEGAFFSHLFIDDSIGLVSCMTEDGYTLRRDVATYPDSVIPFTAVELSLEPTGTETKTILLFRDEANVEEFLRGFELEAGTYAYKEDVPEGEAAPAAMSEAVYTIRCVDQNGDPVPGVMVQICDPVSCRVAQSNAQGMHEFTSAPCAWEIHVLMAPAGYSASGEAVIAPVTGGEITLTLNKN